MSACHFSKHLTLKCSPFWSFSEERGASSAVSLLAIQRLLHPVLSDRSSGQIFFTIVAEVCLPFFAQPQFSCLFLDEACPPPPTPGSLQLHGFEGKLAHRAAQGAQGPSRRSGWGCRSVKMGDKQEVWNGWVCSFCVLAFKTKANGYVSSARPYKDKSSVCVT